MSNALYAIDRTVYTLNVDGLLDSTNVKTWPADTDLEAITAEVKVLVNTWNDEFAAWSEMTDGLDPAQRPPFESKALPGLCEGGDVWLFCPNGKTLLWHQPDDTHGEWI